MCKTFRVFSCSKMKRRRRLSLPVLAVLAVLTVQHIFTNPGNRDISGKRFRVNHPPNAYYVCTLYCSTKRGLERVQNTPEKAKKREISGPLKITSVFFAFLVLAQLERFFNLIFICDATVLLVVFAQPKNKCKYICLSVLDHKKACKLCKCIKYSALYVGFATKVTKSTT